MGYFFHLSSFLPIPWPADNHALISTSIDYYCQVADFVQIKPKSDHSFVWLLLHCVLKIK